MKVLGALAVAVCCYLAGCSFSAKQKASCANLHGIIRLLTHMQSRIKNSAMPLAEIFASFSDDALEKCGFLPELRLHGAAGFANALSMLDLPPDCSDALEIFGGTLGTLCADDQLSELALVLGEMTEHYGRTVKALPTKQKITRTVWGLAGALIAIMLI